MFSAKIIKQHAANVNTIQRVKIKHHVRSIDVHNMLKATAEVDIIPSYGCGEDEYTMRCQNLLNNCPESFLGYMWNINATTVYKFDSKIKTDLTNSNFFLSRNNGEATIIFTSLTNARQNEFVKIANEWSKRNELNLLFISVNGDNMKTADAEIIANYEVDCHQDNHIVFVTANMAARSFSVPKIVNGIMMVNEPGLASAEQKYNRLSTIDYDNENKIGNMYWFNFTSMKCVCPLYNLLYNDLLENKKKKDTNGKNLVNMFDCVDIFEQVGQRIKEKTHVWTEQDIFESIVTGTISHDEITAHIVNFCPELSEAIADMVKTFKLNLVGLNVANWKIGKTMQAKINGTGRSMLSNKKELTEKEKKTRILNLEVATSLVGLTLGHENRNFNNFVQDACHIFSSTIVKHIGKTYLEILWNDYFVKTITELAYKC